MTANAHRQYRGAAHGLPRGVWSSAISGALETGSGAYPRAPANETEIPRRFFPLLTGSLPKNKIQKKIPANNPQTNPPFIICYCGSIWSPCSGVTAAHEAQLFAPPTPLCQTCTRCATTRNASPQIDTEGWLFLVLAIGIIAAAVIHGQRHDGANAPVSHVVAR